MKYVKQVQTADGKVHASEEAAKKYLDAKFGDIIVPLARQVAEIEKFKAALDFIEQNLPLFVRAYRSTWRSMASPKGCDSWPHDLTVALAIGS